MKNFFQVVGVIVLMVGSFIYTEDVQKASKTSDSLLNEIKSKKDGYKENAIEPIVKDNTIAPGVNGREVDVKKSYEAMSKIGYFDDKLLVYKTLFVENLLDKNKDKYILIIDLWHIYDIIFLILKFCHYLNIKKEHVYNIRHIL